MDARREAAPAVPGFTGADDYAAVAFSRNLGLLTPIEQRRLADAAVAIPGLGGVGGAHLLTLARAGVGRFRLADRGAFEPVDVNRQPGANAEHFGRPKLEVLAERARAVNPWVQIAGFPGGVTRENLDAFLDGADVVVDGLDLRELELRRALFLRAQERGMPVVTAAPLGFSAALLVFTPGGMSFDDYFDLHDALPDREKLLRFALGLAPRAAHLRDLARVPLDLEAGFGPSLGLASQLCAGVAAAEVLRLLLGRPGVRPAPAYLQLDADLQVLRRGRLRGGNRNPLQRARLWYARRLVSREEAARPPSPPVASGVSAEALGFVIRAGMQAPSADNAQPWRFAVRGAVVDLFLDPAADGSSLDVRRLASVVACGAALENMRLAATACGLRATVEPLPSPDAPEHMGRLTLGAAPPTAHPDPLAEALWRRCTNRRPYREDPVADDVLAHLQDVAGSAGARLHVVAGLDRLEALAGLVDQADRLRASRRDLREHLVRTLRFTEREVLATRDGLPLRTLELGRGGEACLRVARDRLGAARLAARLGAREVVRSGAAALLTVAGRSAADFLRGGRALERVWLEATRLGLAVQPVTALTLLFLRAAEPGGGGLTPEEAARVGRLAAAWRALFPALDPERDGQVMLVRLGFGPPPRARTLRKHAPALACDPDVPRRR